MSKKKSDPPFVKVKPFGSKAPIPSPPPVILPKSPTPSLEVSSTHPTVKPTVVEQHTSAPKVKQFRESVIRIIEAGRQNVELVREGVKGNQSPFEVIKGPTRDTFANSFDAETAEIVRSTIDLGVKNSKIGSIPLPPRPEIDFAEVDNDPTYGSLDGFYVKVVASLPFVDLDQDGFGKVSFKGIRLLRATGKVLDVSAPASSILIDGGPKGQLKKNNDPSVLAYRAAEIGVGSKVTQLVADGENVPHKVKKTIGKPLETSNFAVNTNRGSSPASLISLKNADRSVLENIGFALNRGLNDPKPPPLKIPVRVGNRQGINVIKGSGISTGGPPVTQNNSEAFKEILSIPISEKNVRRVGDFIEIDLYDPTVVFGREYTYYVVVHDGKGLESPRSRLVTVPVMVRTQPERTDVLYSVIAGRPRFSVSCKGKFLDHVEVFRKGGDRPVTSRMLGTDGSIVTDGSPTSILSGFYHLTDLGIGVAKSISFTDTKVRPGQKLVYRFYTVDAFGNKSQTPFECEIKIPGPERNIPLSVPSISVEQVARTENISVRAWTDDERITNFVVGRREVGNGEYQFRQPSEPDRVNLGVIDKKRAGSRVGPRLVDPGQAWVGTFRVSSGTINFVDGSVSIDRTYQYSVYGVDRRGTISSHAISKYIRPAVKPIIEAPSAFKGEVLRAGSELQVKLSWTGPSNDFSPAELIGDQDVLNATSVRSVYQVERREIGKPNWDLMPPTTGTFFVETAGNDKTPSYRPSFPEVSKVYEYRVIAMQSGGFLSNYSEPLRLEILPNAAPLDLIWVRMTDTAVRPVKIVVSWNSDDTFADGWEIERAAVNKLFGSKITSISSSVVKGLQYERVGVVKREASRAKSLVDGKLDDPTVFVGNRFFIDDRVTMDNVYFYRVRPEGVETWTYGGISTTDSLHDRKLMSILTDAEKLGLLNKPDPVEE